MSFTKKFIVVNCKICSKEIDLRESLPAIYKPTGERILLCETCASLVVDGNSYRLIKNERDER